MNDVILNVLYRLDDIPNQTGIGWDLNPERIFNCSHGADGMYRCSDPSYALRKVPGLAWISPSQNPLETAEHGATAPGIGDLPVFNLDFDAQVTLDAGYRINCDFRHLFSPFA